MAISPVIFQCFQQDQDEAKLQLDLSFASQCVPESPRGLVKIPIGWTPRAELSDSVDLDLRTCISRFSPDADATSYFENHWARLAFPSFLPASLSFCFFLQTQGSMNIRILSQAASKEPDLKIVFHPELDLQDLKCPSHMCMYMMKAGSQPTKKLCHLNLLRAT